MKPFTLKLIIILSLLYSTNTFAWFEEFRQSVRGRALGNTSGTTWHGVESMYYNPATIAHLESFQMMGGYARPAGGFTSFDDGSSIKQIDFAFVSPFVNPVNLYTAGWKGDVITRRAAMGFSYSQQAYDSGDGTAGVTQKHMGFYYGKNLDNILFQGARISAGVTANLYSLSFNGVDVENNAAFTNTSSSAFSPDVGVVYNFSDFILVSLTLENLIATRISPFPDGESLTSSTNIGVAWMLGSIGEDIPFLQDILISGLWKTISAPDQGQDVSANIASSSMYNAGWESWFRSKHVDIAARLGFGVGDQSYSEVAAGLGFSRYFDPAQKYRFDVNFTWVWSSFASSLGSDHRYYAGGVFHYAFQPGQFPGARVVDQLGEVEEDLDKVPEDTKENREEDKKEGK